jgi:hypothetical protein
MNNPFPVNDLVIQRKFIKNNEYMSKKLNYIEPTIDQTCPESFIFYKTIKKNYKYKSFRSKIYFKYFISDVYIEYEKQKQNELMLKKLEKIYTNSRKKVGSPPSLRNPNFNKNDKKPLTDRTSSSSLSPMKDTKRKWEILKITQDNQSFLKRLIESKPCYIPNTKFPKLENFNFNTTQSLNPKNSREIFKCKNEISIENNNNNNFNISQKNSRNDIGSKTDHDFFKFKNNLSHSERSKSSQINFDFIKNGENTKIVLYKRHGYIINLSIVYLEFILVDKK